MATNAMGGTLANRATRLLTTVALVCMYLFGSLAATGAALTFSATPAEAWRGRGGRWRGRYGRRGWYGRGWRGRRGWRGWRGRRGRRGPGFCFYIHGVSFCGR
jgi:hypothetical protein